MLPQSDTEAYLWARKAAEAGLVKAMYAVGYFSECGIGTQPDMKECVFLFSFSLPFRRDVFSIPTFSLEMFVDDTFFFFLLCQGDRVV